MEFLSAFSGLERIAIIAAAIVVGYWGFRLFATDRTPGLVFMGVACAVLVAVLVTGTRHVESVSSSLKTASEQAPSTAAEPESTPPIELETAQAEILAAEPAPEEAPSEEPPAAIAEPEPEPAEVVAEATEPDEPEAEVTDILSARDLGGRIVSVKSENVTLEWTPPSSE